MRTFQQTYIKALRYTGLFAVILICIHTLLVQAVADYGFLSLISPSR